MKKYAVIAALLALLTALAACRVQTERAAAACLAPGQHWATTLSTTFER